MNKSSKINVNASSLVGLKAELFKKQEQLKRDRLQPGSSTSSNKNKHRESKKPSVWSKNNTGVQGRASKDLEQLADERDELDKARNKLEAKAQFYEKMTKKGYIPDADSDQRFLVDFEKKALDEREQFKHRVEELEKEEDIPPPDNPDEEWVDYTDTLGRSRRCMRKDLPNLISMDKKLNPQVYESSEQQKGKTEVEKKEEVPDLMSNDMYREMLRKKWEEEEEAAAKGPLGSTHYQNVKFDEVRDMGVGYFDFSKDQTQRNQQMETLQLLRDETVGQRERREKLKLKRKAAMKARLEKIKERKRQKGEVIEDDEDEAEEDEKEEKMDEKLPEAAEKNGTPSKETKVREWDIGKEPVSAWDQRLKNMRDERPAEFAPPSIYSDTSQKRGPHQAPMYPPPKDYNSPFSNKSTLKAASKQSCSTSSELLPPKSYHEKSIDDPHHRQMNLSKAEDYSSYGNLKNTVNESSSAVSSNSSQGMRTDVGLRSSMNLPPPKDYSLTYGRAKQDIPGIVASSQSPQAVSRSMMNLPPPRDLSSTYGRAKETSGKKSSTGHFSHWNKPSGSSDWNQPSSAAGGTDFSSRGGTENKGTQDGEVAIASALSYFRKNTGK